MRRSVVVLGVIGALVVTALWWLLIIGPRNSEIDDVEQQIDAAITREATLRTQLSQLGAIRDLEVSYLAAIGEMESAIPPSPEIDAFIEDVNFLAQQTGVTLSALALSPPAETPENPAFEIRAAMSVMGEYFEILGFLYGLEAMERIVRVDTLSLQPIEVEPEPPPQPDGEVDEDGEETTTTTEPEEPQDPSRARPSPSFLQMGLTATLFTRTPVVVVVPDTIPPEGEETTTTTTSTTTTTAAEGEETTTTTPTTTTTGGGSS